MESEQLFNQIKEAIRVHLDISRPSNDRLAAAQFIERLQNCDSASAVKLFDVGFKLLAGDDSEYNSNYVHFGFQLIELAIKMSWNMLDTNQKSSIKLELEKIITANQSTERHVKDGISKCVVEVMFREWPQNWPAFLNTLLGKCC